MGATTTVMFADLTGSTGVFEALGNQAATQAVTGLTDWIARTCEAHGGRVVKTLGDGVLAVFADAGGAVDAAVDLQREHAGRQARPGPEQRLQLQVGLACGEIVERDGDCFGDAVNVAARLSDLSGARQIWATDTVVEQFRRAPAGTRFHPLGPVALRGKAHPQRVFRIEWREDASTDMMTLPAFEPTRNAVRKRQPHGSITLQFLDLEQEFDAEELPVTLGRAREADFVVAEPRVSRLHARIEWRAGSFVLVDLSSYGSSVRFRGAPTELKLRRDDCVLHDSGEIALGPDFGDFAVPTIRFTLALPGAR